MRIPFFRKTTESVDGKNKKYRLNSKPLMIVLAIVFLALNISALVYLLYFRNLNNTEDNGEFIRPPAFTSTFKGDEKQGILSRPLSAAVDGFGRIFVADTGNRQIQVFDAKGKFLYKFGQKERNYRSNLSVPCYLAISPAGRIYVSDRGWNAIFIYDRNGEFIRQFKPNNKDKFEWAPLGLEFSERGDLYVCDAIANKVRVFDTTGKLKNDIGSPGVKAGQLQFPNDLAIGKDKIYVSDSNNSRVQIFKTNGAFLKVIETSSGAVIGLPRGITVTDEGRLYVVDALGQQVHVFSSQDRYLYSFGAFGSKPNEFNFPNGIAVARDNSLLIVDRENNAVKVWGY